MKRQVVIYTDGACSGNPGPGGWAAILRYRDRERELSGGEAQTTNNRMELTAVIAALEALKEPCAVTVYTDSSYVCDAVTKGWAKAWKQRNWVKSNKTSAKNPDLWDKLLELISVHDASFIWVRGHAENEYNNRCDALAVQERKKYEKKSEG